MIAKINRLLESKNSNGKISFVYRANEFVFFFVKNEEKQSKKITREKKN